MFVYLSAGGNLLIPRYINIKIGRTQLLPITQQPNLERTVNIEQQENENTSVTKQHRVATLRPPSITSTSRIAIGTLEKYFEVNRPQ